MCVCVFKLWQVFAVFIMFLHVSRRCFLGKPLKFIYFISTPSSADNDDNEKSVFLSTTSSADDNDVDDAVVEVGSGRRHREKCRF